MVPASITVQGALSRWARRTAILVVLAIPFVGGVPIVPCVLAAFLYGHVGQPTRRRGQFRITRDGVESNEGVLVLPRASFVLPAADGDDGRGPGISFLDMEGVVSQMTFESVPARDEALASLGFGNGPIDVRSDGFVGPEVRAALGSAGALAATMAIAIGARRASIFAILASVAALVYAVRHALKRDFRVGDDGIHVRAPFIRAWVPFDELRGVSVGRAWVRLHTTTGDVDIGGPAFGPAAARAREALATLIRAARARHEQKERPSALLLEAHAESVFRAIPRSTDALLELVESARVEPALRVRAASALLHDPRAAEIDARARVAACAERSANPALARELRAVLSRAS